MSMLVLTRKPGETIIIADNIRITVVGVGPGRVKIGIEAPPSVKVDRQEVHEKRQAEAAPPPAEVPQPLVVNGAAPVLHNRIAARLEPPAGGVGRPIVRRFPPRKPR
jgi:carbon storage regulator